MEPKGLVMTRVPGDRVLIGDDVLIIKAHGYVHIQTDERVVNNSKLNILEWGDIVVFYQQIFAVKVNDDFEHRYPAVKLHIDAPAGTLIDTEKHNA